MEDTKGGRFRVTACPRCGRKALMNDEMEACFSCLCDELSKEVFDMDKCKVCGKETKTVKRGMCYDCYRKYVYIIDFSDLPDLWLWINREAERELRPPQMQVIYLLKKMMEESDEQANV